MKDYFLATVFLLIIAGVLVSGCTSTTESGDVKITEQNAILTKTFTSTSDGITTTIVTNELDKTATATVVFDESYEGFNNNMIPAESMFQLMSKTTASALLYPDKFNDAVNKWNSEIASEQPTPETSNTVPADSGYAAGDYTIQSVTVKAYINGKYTEYIQTREDSVSA